MCGGVLVKKVAKEKKRKQDYMYFPKESKRAEIGKKVQVGEGGKEGTGRGSNDVEVNCGRNEGKEGRERDGRRGTRTPSIGWSDSRGKNSQDMKLLCIGRVSSPSLTPPSSRDLYHNLFVSFTEFVVPERTLTKIWTPLFVMKIGLVETPG